MRALSTGVSYFAIVFGAGFVLGPIRVLWLVPRVGTRTAELLEAPLMLAVIVLAARWRVGRLVPPPTPAERLGAGLVALGLVVAAEAILVVPLRGLTAGEYLATRDPVAGAVYVGTLGLLAVMPLLVRRR
jgi:hypothetical protein